MQRVAPMRPQLGRPKDIAKREAILKAAKHLFARHGFEAVTMELVAAQAAVSKMTVYSHFNDKETLFESFVMSISDQMTNSLHAPGSDKQTLRDRLVAMGRVFLDVVFGPIAFSMLLSMSAIASKQSSLGKRFYEAGPGRTRAALIAIISDYAERGELTIDRAEWAADDLLGLWDGGLPAKVIFAIDRPLGSAEIERRAVRAVDVFLRAYATSSDVSHAKRGRAR